ncbi:MAG: hypothetical protein HQK83_05810 [Fibrobacteria bacterium]|nr:hypothetical protein [Fibrobacteria bacterium]
MGDWKWKPEQVLSLLRNLSVQLGVSLVVLSGLHASLRDRDDPAPLLQDLRPAGIFERYAENILLVYRKEVYDKGDPSLAGKIELRLAKSEHGRNRRVFLRFNKDTGVFSLSHPA